MHRVIVILITLLIILVPFSVYTQETQELSLDSGSLDSQFEYILTKSSPYLEFRVVEEAWLKKLNSNVNDSIKLIKKELTRSSKSISAKEKEIDSLESVLQNTRTELSNSKKEKNSLRFFGILMGKAAYNSLMILIIDILAATVLVLIISYKRSHAITARTKQDLEDIRKEFEEHRTHTRLREEKIVREYHYELNKYKNR